MLQGSTKIPVLSLLRTLKLAKHRDLMATESSSNLFKRLGGAHSSNGITNETDTTDSEKHVIKEL